MSANQFTALFLFAALTAASLPFFLSRGFGVILLRRPKSLALYGLESILLFAVVVGLALVYEASTGQRAAQTWPFYVVLICLWAVLAFPGFLWRYLRKRPSPRPQMQEYE